MAKNTIFTKDFFEIEKENIEKPINVNKTEVKGWIKWAFWALRIYIVVMLMLIGMSFLHIK
jgi:hypothetical protein